MLAAVGNQRRDLADGERRWRLASPHVGMESLSQRIPKHVLDMAVGALEKDVLLGVRIVVCSWHCLIGACYRRTAVCRHPASTMVVGLAVTARDNTVTFATSERIPRVRAVQVADGKAACRSSARAHLGDSNDAPGPDRARAIRRRRRRARLHGCIEKTQKTANDDIALPKHAGRSGRMRKGNKRRGSDFDDFVRGEAIFDDVQAAALKRALAEAVDEAMMEGNLSKVGGGKTHRDKPIATRSGARSDLHGGATRHVDQGRECGRSRLGCLAQTSCDLSPPAADKANRPWRSEPVSSDSAGT